MILLVLFHLGGGFVKAIPFPPIYLFFCVEGLSTLIKKVEIKGEICGIKICNKAPNVSHLLFVDDCFLFFKSSLQEYVAIRNNLEVYGKASGQCLNLQ